MTDVQQSPPTLAPAPSVRSLRQLRPIGKSPMLLVLAIELVVTTFVDHGFWTVVNIQNLLTQNSPLAVASVGMTLVIIAGGFDLSVGSIFGAGAVFYISMDGRLPVVVTILLVIVVGAVCGIFNGTVVSVLGVNPFVATLGSASVISGLVSLYYFHSKVKFASSPSYRKLGTGVWGKIPASFIVAAIVIVVVGLVLAKTTYGRSVYAIGGNQQAARLNGLRVGLLSASTFILIGTLAAVGGLLQASAVATADPTFGTTLTLQSIAVVIIGGTSLLGGEGAVWRTVVGISILAVLDNVFAARSVDPNLQSVIQGMIVIVAVAVDVWVYRRKT